MDTLLVMAFVVVVSAIILIPFVSSQGLTNSGAKAKLFLLPFLERNHSAVKISSIGSSVLNNVLTLTVSTRGEIDASIKNEIQSPTSTFCADFCNEVKSVSTFASTALQWNH